MAIEPNMVEPCKGWLTSCSFCDKRFSEWVQPDEVDLSEKIPSKPTAYMLALQTKQGKEIVTIGLHPKSPPPHIAISKTIESLKHCITQRKSKETKSTILVKWFILNQADSKDSCSLFAHWNNYGILPRMSSDWPGLDLLHKTDHFELSRTNQKWCHPSKDPIWRKPKSTVEPRAIKRCKGWFESCNFCDQRFSPWVKTEDCHNLALPSSGFLMFSVLSPDQKREIVFISKSDTISKDIHTVESYVNFRISYDPLYKGKNYTTNVRWMPVSSVKSEEACLLYAHWYNCGTCPKLSADEPTKDYLGCEDLLEDNAKFTYRSRDKQWCFISEPKDKIVKHIKFKNRRNVQQSIEDELLS